jgi:hypothetical protein
VAKARLARKLCALEVSLSGLQDLRDAMNGVVRLVGIARYLNEVKGEGLDETSMESVYADAFDVMSVLADATHWTIGNAAGEFVKLRGDEAIGAELDRVHAHAPMGRVWTGKAFENPYR